MSDTIEPAWLVAAVDQRLALVKDRINSQIAGGFDVILLQLTDPPEHLSHDQWDRSCDNCGVFVPRNERFMVGQAVRTLNQTRVLITVGCCVDCMDLP